MTLLQITAIDVDDGTNGSCRGAIRHAAIGRACQPVDATEIVRDLSEGGNSYFAQIDGRFVDVAAAECPRCRAAHLTSAEAISIRVDNELLRLPQLAPPEPVAPSTPPDAGSPPSPQPVGNWRARFNPRDRPTR